MPSTTTPRPPGRPTKPKSAKLVLVPTFRLPPELAARFAKLGVRDWLVKQLERKQ